MKCNLTNICFLFIPQENKIKSPPEKTERPVGDTYSRPQTHHINNTILPLTYEKLNTKENKDPELINNRQPYDKHNEFDYSRPVGYDKSTEVINTSKNVQKDIENYSKTCRPPSIGSANKERLLDKYINGGPAKRNSSSLTPSSDYNKGPPLASVYCSSQVAKNLALDNQKHQPLPDTIDDALYHSLQLKREKNPELGLNVEPRASAVGCKVAGTPGPTQCSKLKIYRPKTAASVQRNNKQFSEMVRPKTSGYEKRLSKEPHHISEMELAICWDLKPDCPDDEPKKSPHIDGSNGSAAPAVFSLVHQLPQVEGSEKPPPQPQHSKLEHKDTQDSFKSVSQGSAEKARLRPKTAWAGDDAKTRQLQQRLARLKETANPSAVMDIINLNDVAVAAKENKSPNIGNTKPNSPPTDNQHQYGGRRKSINGESHSAGCSSLPNTATLAKKKVYQSSPNLTSAGIQTQNEKNNKNRLLNSRPCMACDHKSSPMNAISTPPRPKSEYKMAFKAGKPNNSANNSLNNSRDGSQEGSPSSLRQNSKNLQVPKPKPPFAKRTYSIGTLAPPFSLWPGTTGQSYPEHWRLASVYQHSYKPVEARRKPLLQSVYQ